MVKLSRVKVKVSMCEPRVIELATVYSKDLGFLLVLNTVCFRKKQVENAGVTTT